MRQKYLVFWSPEGRQVAEVWARNPHHAISLAPKPYRLFPGECYAVTPGERELQLEGERIREGITNPTQDESLKADSSNIETATEVNFPTETVGVKDGLVLPIVA